MAAFYDSQTNRERLFSRTSRPRITPARDDVIVPKKLEKVKGLRLNQKMLARSYGTAHRHHKLF